MARRKGVEAKLAIVGRAEAGADVRTLAAETGVSPGQIYRWCRGWRARGAAALRRGGLKPALTAGEPPVPRLPPPGTAAARIAALERKVAEQALELDFFRTALQQIEASRRASGAPGATASTPASGRGRSGRAG